jgi:hypothetical protein
MNPLRGTPQGLTAVLRWPGGDARLWAERAFSRLCASENVVAVVLFGSAIRPATDSFDLDCLYVYQGDHPTLPSAPMEVDIRAYHVDQVEPLIAAGHDLLVWSIRLGALVCERDAYWTRLRESWLTRLPFPSPEVAESRAEHAERILADLREMGDEDAAAEQQLTALTHRARAALLRASVFPASRPELPGQLRQIGQSELADSLAAAMEKRKVLANQYVDRIRDIA